MEHTVLKNIIKNKRNLPFVSDGGSRFGEHIKFFIINVVNIP